MEFRQSPSVAIDGDAIRRIREEKRLTQLYVSKVVGVTTDTVSRWENNRYPTIRRDNVIKLAEALEVEIDAILKKDDEVENDIFDSQLDSPKKRWPLIAVIVGILGLLSLYFLQTGSYNPPALQAQRLLPPYAAPGSQVLIRVKLAAEKTLGGMILREEFPKGWQLIQADPPPSSLDNQQGVVRWIFRKPKLQTNVSYMLKVADDAKMNQVVQLSGELIANPDGRRSAIPVESVGRMVVKPYHWADTNGNQRIDDLEMLEVSELLDVTGQLHLDWDLMEKIWDAGGYQWHPESEKFVPLSTPKKTSAPASPATGRE